MTFSFPYFVNIVVLLPVASLTLFGGSEGVRWVSQGRFAESPGIRTILGSIWMALLIASVLGLHFPVFFALILLVHVLYKTLWTLTSTLPRLITRHAHEVPLGIAITFAAIVVTYPWAVDWTRLVGEAQPC